MCGRGRASRSWFVGLAGWLVSQAGNNSSQSTTTKNASRFRRVNISQSETALCNAVLAQSGTDAMVPLVPWPVPGHQRLDARQSPLGASQHAKKKKKQGRSSGKKHARRTLNVVCTFKLFAPYSKSYASLRSVSLVAHEYSEESLISL